MAYTTLVRNDKGEAIPAGMSLLIPRYPHLPAQDSQDATFMWFISAVPKEVLSRLGVVTPPSLGDILIDIAMVLSTNSGSSGRIGLHCAVSGGTRLMEFYQRRQLNNLPESVIMVVTRRNDGRFFFADEDLAEAFMFSVDGSR